MERAREATRFLWDITAYTQAAHQPLENLVIDPLTLKRTGFTALEEQAMAKNLSPLTGTAYGSVYGFKIPELLKARCRPVWACYINDAIETKGYKLHSQHEIWRELMDAARIITFDGKSMYDQFALENNVNQFFAFRLRDGSPASLAKLPMGFGPACEIAQLCALILASFGTDSTLFTVTPIVHIDNFAFVIKPRTSCWHQEDLEQFTTKVITEFFRRCKEVNFQLNEADDTTITNYLNSPHSTCREMHKDWCPDEFVLLGVQYNIQRRTRAIAPKTINKLQAIKKIMFPNDQLAPNTTPRQLAIAVGVARWAARSISHKHVHFQLFTALAKLGSTLVADMDLWDRPLTSTAPFSELITWVNSILENKPHSIWHFLPEKFPVLIVDASSKGWGGILVNNLDVSILSGQWPIELTHSSEAEPKGTLEAIRAANLNTSDLVIVTDHQPLIYAALSQQARGWHYYSLLNSLKHHWPQCHFHFTFVEGTHNPADAPSRQRDMNHDQSYCRAMAAAAGMGASWALLNPLPREIPGLLVSTLFDANQSILSSPFW